MNRVKRFINSFVLLGLFMVPFNFVLAADTDYRYTGKPLDANTNLYYYGQRYYDPNVGRFTQPDPALDVLSNPQKLKEMTGKQLDELLSNPQRLNPYSYVLNNPVQYTDPTGESEMWAWLVSPKLTATGVAVWNAFSKGYFRDRGDIISATLLERSLKLRVGNNLDMNINKNKDPYNIINIIKQSEEYKTFVKEKMEQAKKSGEVFINFDGGIKTGQNSLVFSDGDLATTLGKITNIHIDGKMLDNGTWQLNVKMYDQYNFEITDEYKKFINTTGNNLAVLSQTQGAISNYDINIEFNDTW